MRPARQGDFDGLCGVYAILNCLDVAGLRLRRSKLHADLFKELTYALGAVSLLSAMQDGLTGPELIRAAQVAFRWLSGEHGVELTIYQPFQDFDFADVPSFLKVVEDEVSRKAQGLILNVHMRGRDHWTVPCPIEGAQMVLRDSSKLAVLKLDDFRLDHGPLRFAPAETLMIERVG